MRVIILIIFLPMAGIFGQRREVSRYAVGGVGGELPKIWALVVGVAEYENAGIEDLRYTKDDAYLVSNFLQRPEGGGIPDRQLVRLIDERATRENIMGGLRYIEANAGAEDIIFIYFAGHGLEGIFLAYDYNFKGNGILHSEIVASVSRSRAKHKIIIGDACASGSIEGAIGTLGGRGRSVAQVSAAMRSYYRAFEENSAGVAFIMSAKAREEAIEYQGLQQGVFSYYLLAGLKGAANRNGDGLVTIDELFSFVQANVGSYTGGKQTPTIMGNYSKDMPMGAVVKP